MRQLNVWLVHANAAKARSLEQPLSASGYRVIYTRWNSHWITRAKAEPPAVVVVEASGSPSTARDIAVAMRSHEAMLTVPFVVVKGTSANVASVRALLPDLLESGLAALGRRA